MRRFLLLCACAVLSGGCLMEEKFIFFPAAAIEATPRDAGLAFEDVYFTAADGTRLNGWLVPHPGAAATVLWLHGNAGNIGDRVGGLKLFQDKVKAGVFMIDYRGYGRSAGTVSEAGTYEDARAALEYLKARKDVDANRIVVFGQSLGAAVAADLAGREACLAVILEAPFASIPDMARAVYPWLPAALIRTRYDVVEKIKKIKSPVLVAHGERDDVVPFEQGRRVFAAAPEPKKFYPIPGARHNDTFYAGGEAYFTVIKDFIERSIEARK